MIIAGASLVCLPVRGVSGHCVAGRNCALASHGRVAVSVAISHGSVRAKIQLGRRVGVATPTRPLRLVGALSPSCLSRTSYVRQIYSTIF